MLISPAWFHHAAPKSGPQADCVVLTWELLPQFPLFPLREWFPDPWVSCAALCDSNCWTESRGLISKPQPRGYAASSWLQALNSSEKIPVENMSGTFKQGARQLLSTLQSLMWSMRKAGRTEASCRKGADHSANKTENTFDLVVTVHQEAQLKSFISFSIREVSLHPVKENDVQTSRFAHL